MPGLRFRPGFRLGELAAGSGLLRVAGDGARELFRGLEPGERPSPLFSWLAVRFGIASLPRGVGWRGMLGAGFLADIEFTMSLFVGGLAFEGDEGLPNAAKVGILAASVVAACVGLTLLSRRPEGDDPPVKGRAWPGRGEGERPPVSR